MTPSTAKTPLSTEFPKWLYAKGKRDIKVNGPVDEQYYREMGYSHEVVAEDPTPAPGSTSAAPAANSAALIDSLLEAQGNRFDRKWADKCAECEDLKCQIVDLRAECDNLRTKVTELTTKAPKAAAPTKAATPADPQ